MAHAQVQQFQPEEQQTEEYTVQTQGTAPKPKIYYETVGAGPPLILVHGLGGSRRWWRKNLEALAAHFTVYTVDLIGFGKSRDGHRFVLNEAADALYEWLNALGLEHVTLIGHSMGGRIGAELAVDHPGSVERLVLIDSPVLPFGHGTIRQLWGMFEALLIAPIDLLRVLIVDTLHTGPITTLRIGRELLHTDIAKKLAQLQLPTLIIWGERDTIVPKRIGEELAAQLGQERFVLLRGAGHVPMWERPAAFNRAVLGFLGVANHND